MIRIINRNYAKEVAKQVIVKKRYRNHEQLFNVPFYKHDTKLSKEYWNLKMKQLNSHISWKIKEIHKSCNLCLTDKLEILYDPDKNTFCIKDQKSYTSVVTRISIDLKHQRQA